MFCLQHRRAVHELCSIQKIVSVQVVRSINTDAKRILFSVSMSNSITLYIMDFKQNTSFIKELYFLTNSMRKVNMSSDLSNLYYLIPTIVLIISINTLAVILFKSLETNFVYKMIIFDSINNILLTQWGPKVTRLRSRYPSPTFVVFMWLFTTGWQPLTGSLL